MTDEGRFGGGLRLHGRSVDSVVLPRPGGERQTVARAAIDTLNLRTRSLMPEGFDRQITSAEFADLIAFLRSRDR